MIDLSFTVPREGNPTESYTPEYRMLLTPSDFDQMAEIAIHMRLLNDDRINYEKNPKMWASLALNYDPEKDEGREGPFESWRDAIKMVEVAPRKSEVEIRMPVKGEVSPYWTSNISAHLGDYDVPFNMVGHYMSRVETLRQRTMNMIHDDTMNVSDVSKEFMTSYRKEGRTPDEINYIGIVNKNSVGKDIYARVSKDPRDGSVTLSAEKHMEKDARESAERIGFRSRFAQDQFIGHIINHELHHVYESFDEIASTPTPILEMHVGEHLAEVYRTLAKNAGTADEKRVYSMLARYNEAYAEGYQREAMSFKFGNSHDSKLEKRVDELIEEAEAKGLSRDEAVQYAHAVVKSLDNEVRSDAETAANEEVNAESAESTNCEAPSDAPSD